MRSEVGMAYCQLYETNGHQPSVLSMKNDSLLGAAAFILLLRAFALLACLKSPICVSKA
jgi:hypothetical protein